MDRRYGFKLLELAVVVLIIAIVITLTIPAVSKLRARAQRAQCMANLKSLHVGAELYIQDNNQWPQIGLTGDDESAFVDYSKSWIAALTPYKIERKTWICPTIQSSSSGDDYMVAGNERVDYVGVTFDEKPTTPHQWPRMPWFVEHGDVHGNGNLIIFADGSISDLKTVAAGAFK